MARKKIAPEPLPRRVMGDVNWIFNRPTYATRAEFDEAVRAYLARRGEESGWPPDGVVIPRPAVKVRYITWERGKQIEPVLELTADNGASFTAGELLFKVHNAVANSLSRIDHKYFEGFRLSGDPGINEVPLYDVNLGS
jgi:hypothetical protein